MFTLSRLSLARALSISSLLGVGAVPVVVAACEGGDDGAGEEGEGEEGEGEEGEGEGLVESEPNGGDPVTEVNVLPVDASLVGVIDGADDVDFFRLDGAVAGHLYVVSASGDFDARLAVLDDGRGGDAPGADYVRLGHGHLFFAVLGGGVFVAVDDDVGSGGAYNVNVVDITLDLTQDAIVDDVSGALDDASVIVAYPFDADAGSDVIFDLDTAGDGDFRLFVVSLSTGDWIARNDDRAVDDVNPLIDAPLFEEGPYVLLVENNEQTATSLNYTITATLPQR